MFNYDITRTYNHQDASLEIIIMLAGAFLLGCVLCWLIRKLVAENSHDLQFSSNQHHHQELYDIKHGPQTTSTPRVVKSAAAQSESTHRTPRIDDLTKLSGIDSDIQSALKKEGINSFTDLRDIKRQILKKIQENSPKLRANKKEVETWPHQASLAAKGDWKKLKEYQDFIQRAQIASQNVLQTKPDNADDLTVVEGVGPKIEEILNNNNIYTFNQLSNTDSMILKKYIVDVDARFENNETESWPHQAAMAEKGQWDELNIYQEFMHSDSSADSVISPEAAPTAIHEPEETNQNDHDDLKKIEGIGSKIEEVLNNNGIYTFRQLYNSDRNRLKELLNDAGNQFRMHDPHSWPHQAGMADRGEWKELKTYQKFMYNGREQESTRPVSLHVKTVPDKKSNIINKKDDLKKIEGIGPKIEELLNSHGINSFHELAKSTRDTIKQYLDDAGPQFRVHEPESWPHQAKLADSGAWEELEKYQELLINGSK